MSLEDLFLKILGAVLSSIVLHWYLSRRYRKKPQSTVPTPPRRSLVMKEHIEQFNRDFRKQFPQLPVADLLEGVNKSRLIYSKYETGTDYSFFIEFSAFGDPCLEGFIENFWRAELGLSHESELVLKIKDLWNAIKEPPIQKPLPRIKPKMITEIVPQKPIEPTIKLPTVKPLPKITQSIPVVSVDFPEVIKKVITELPPPPIPPLKISHPITEKIDLRSDGMNRVNEEGKLTFSKTKEPNLWHEFYNILNEMGIEVRDYEKPTNWAHWPSTPTNWALVKINSIPCYIQYCNISLSHSIGTLKYRVRGLDDPNLRKIHKVNGKIILLGGRNDKTNLRELIKSIKEDQPEEIESLLIELEKLLDDIEALIARTRLEHVFVFNATWLWSQMQNINRPWWGTREIYIDILDNFTMSVSNVQISGDDFHKKALHNYDLLKLPAHVQARLKEVVVPMSHSEEILWNHVNKILSEVEQAKIIDFIRTHKNYL
ncbi:MAG: hypothetical protein JSW11_13670 [Candidatus Heimdallarchaeota archaeon]|nr:MAG: hypothetical protein JSW11_13670 [Candidatus Heimdallarchaeota archaeon]